MKTQSALLRVSMWIFISCGIWLIVLGGYFLFIRSPLRHVFTVMGGFIAGCGVLVVFVSLRVVPQCAQGTGFVLGATGLLTVAIMSWINFALDADFKWLLLVPALAWLVGLVTFAAGRRAEQTIVATAQAITDALP